MMTTSILAQEISIRIDLPHSALSSSAHHLKIVWRRGSPWHFVRCFSKATKAGTMQSAIFSRFVDGLVRAPCAQCRPRDAARKRSISVCMMATRASARSAMSRIASGSAGDCSATIDRADPTPSSAAWRVASHTRSAIRATPSRASPAAGDRDCSRSRI